MVSNEPSNTDCRVSLANPGAEVEGCSNTPQQGTEIHGSSSGARLIFEINKIKNMWETRNKPINFMLFTWVDAGMPGREDEK